jgi:hypothetical protein
MITATVFDQYGAPISGDFQIVGDDFSLAIAAAESSGTRCCIQWQRIEDGQVAYYGPRGCQLSPHWYNMHGGSGRGQGRKALKPGEETRPVTINLASSQAAKLKALGGAPWVREQIDSASFPETEHQSSGHKSRAGCGDSTVRISPR